MNKETFFEKFAKIYQYPYGTGFQKDTEDYSDFERYLKRKQYYNPFHVDCPKTKKMICYWDEFKLHNHLIDPFKDVVFRLQNYYEGFDDQKEEKMKHKLQFEKERFMNVTHPEFTHTYDRYLQYIEEDDILEYETQLKAERKQWVYCHKFYYGNPMAKINPTANKDLPKLCETCCKKYINGFVGSGTENKKIARALGHPLVVRTKTGPNYDDSDSLKDSNSADQMSSKDQNRHNKRVRDSVSPSVSKGSKRQKTKDNNTAKELKCVTCGSKILYNKDEHSFDCDLVKKIGWVCINCKQCIKCKKSDNESKLLICDKCDRTYHIYCLKPPLESIPTTVWVCEDWEKNHINKKACTGCSIPLERKDLVIFEGFPTCKDCNQLYADGEYCKICKCLYNENESNQNFVCCDTCEKWIHAECDNISKEKLKQMDNSTDKYNCPHWRK